MPIFKCVICNIDIERARNTYWKKRGYVICSTCLDKINTDKKN